MRAAAGGRVEHIRLGAAEAARRQQAGVSDGGFRSGIFRGGIAGSGSVANQRRRGRRPLVALLRE